MVPPGSPHHTTDRCGPSQVRAPGTTRFILGAAAKGRIEGPYSYYAPTAVAMSRKSRQRQKPELGPDEPGAEPPNDSRASVYRLTGELRDMLEAIVSGCAITADTAKLDDELYLDDVPDDELGDDVLDADELTDDKIEASVSEFAEAYGGLALTTRVLARELLARALDRRPTQRGVSLLSAESAEDDADPAVLDKLVEFLLPANLPDAIRPSRQGRREAFGETAWLVREVGLEEFDVSCDLATSAGGTPELFAYSRSPASAHVALLEYLFQRAEGVVENLDPLLAAERDASFWQFSRWSASPPPGRGWVEVTEFTGSVREQEYSLAERRTVTLGTSVMSELARDEGFAELFPRQHRMAAALAASFVDVFECVGLEGTRATLRSIRDGRTVDVHEHMEPITYAPGCIAMGRLLPFDGDLHLRSPGMLFIEPDESTHVKAAVEAFGDARATSSPALALEAFISSAVFGVRVPRSVKPARSKAEARALLAVIDDILGDAELERVRDDVPRVRDELYYTPGLHADSGGTGDAGIRLDATLQAFMAALEDQAAGGGRERHQRPRTKKRKRKRRR